MFHHESKVNSLFFCHFFSSANKVCDHRSRAIILIAISHYSTTVYIYCKT